MSVILRKFILIAAFCASLVSSAYADAVTNWNAILEQVVFATAQPIPAQPRSAAIVHAAIFDAVNGIARKYDPYFVREWAPGGANQEAAAVQAAYTTLSQLYPSQQSVLDAHLMAALNSIPGHQGNSQAIRRGREWGAYVAQKILDWRSTDRWTEPMTPYYGGTGPGVWRSPPTATNADGTLPALLSNFTILTPFLLVNTAQFRPGPPPALSSAEYATDFNEVKAIGRFDSPIRTSDQTQLALLWQASGVMESNRIARSAVPPANRLVDNARLFALLNLVACDSLIVSFDSKYAYNLWRPYHAVRLADTDGNPATEADPAWNSLFTAPRFQEYISNHAILTGSAMHVLTRLLGDNHSFVLSTPNYPNFSWTFERFSDAGLQVQEARIWAGIHFRTAGRIGGELAVKLADYAIDRYMRPRSSSGRAQR